MPRPYGTRGGWRATFAGAVLEYTMRAGFTGQGPATLTGHTADGEQPIDLAATSPRTAMTDHVCWPASPFYRAEKPLPVRRAEAKNVYLIMNT